MYVITLVAVAAAVAQALKTELGLVHRKGEDAVGNIIIIMIIIITTIMLIQLIIITCIVYYYNIVYYSILYDSLVMSH